ncbi:hypothetical protein [Amycolatopsis kentuckyensis]|uniref:hypothetical protein n=1 Tax=Amycolatopsis kentuckyensis TaxID=218823 RepID=UPI003563A84D
MPQGDVTWRSYVDTDEPGTIIVEVLPDTNPMSGAAVPGFRYRVEYLGPALSATE